MNDPQTQAPVPQPQGPGPKVPLIISTVLAGIVVVLLVVIGFLLKQRSQLNQNPNLPGGQTPSEQSSSTPDQVKDDSQNVPQEGYITVDWLAKWEPSSIIPVQDPQNPTEEYKVGKVTSGEFKGQDLFMQIIPGLGTEYKHFVMQENRPVYLQDKNILIHGIHDIPEQIDLPGTAYKLKKNWVANEYFSQLKPGIERKMFTHPTLGDVYLTQDGCFIVELPDHTAISYDLVLPFVNKEARSLKATFNDNTQSQDPYTYTRITGCGALCMYLARMEESELKPSQRLMEVGKTSNGETLYGLKDPQDPALKELYNDENTIPYYSDQGSWERTSKSKYTYEQFLSYRPLLYWKDPIGRWIEFKNDRFQIAAEMCKPVIYLYPQKETELSVKVYPNGGFTYTKPDYKNGWQVVAHPDGTIKNLADGLSYPYLFWEGIGLNYPAQDSGFVVSQKDLEGFLKAKLSLLGLRGREAEDFNAYWLPRLKGLHKPYYKITFLKKEQMDEIAPLDLSVEPTSVIRVMMTAKGLDAYENIPEQELPQPLARSGFTLVEWGGAVLR